MKMNKWTFASLDIVVTIPWLFAKLPHGLPGNGSVHWDNIREFVQTDTYKENS
jgi:hypothetical protein